MEVLVAAVDENRIKNERDNCYGVFPAADGQRSGNSLSPNFVHAIDASHLLMSYTMFAKGRVSFSARNQPCFSGEGRKRR